MECAAKLIFGKMKEGRAEGRMHKSHTDKSIEVITDKYDVVRGRE